MVDSTPLREMKVVISRLQGGMLQHRYDDGRARVEST